MCTVCGCGEGETTIEHSHDPKQEHKHQNGHHHAEPGHKHTHDYGQGAAHAHAPGLSQARMVQIEQDILGKNNQYAAAKREYFNQHGILTLNLVSSPGSGKTTLLTETIALLKGQLAVSVIEGDQQTTHDAERIRATGVKALQINTK
jgi:hydrogenase nickel incorporation protein HypB